MRTPISLLREFCRLHAARLTACFVLDLIANIAALALPVLISQAFAALLGFDSMRGRLLAGPDRRFEFQSILLLTGFVVLLKAALDFGCKRLHGRVSEDLVWWLRDRCFRQQLRLDLQQYEAKGIGRFLLRFSGDLGSVQQLVAKGILQFTADVLLIIIGLVVISWLHSGLGLLVLVWLALFALIAWRVNLRLRAVESQRRNQKSGLLAFINQRLLHIATLKALNRETGELQRFARRADKIRVSGLAYHGQAALLEALASCTVYGLLCAVMLAIWGAKEMGGVFQAGHLFAVILILISWRTVLGRVVQVGLVWNKGWISLQKITRMLDFPQEPGYERNGDTKLGASAVPLVLDRVSYREIVRDLSCRVEPGSTVFLHMPAEGSGGVLAKLLAGLYQPESGAIYLGETPLSDLHPRTLRRQFSFVSEVFPLFGKNLLEAVACTRKPGKLHTVEQVFHEWQQIFPLLSRLDPRAPLLENHSQMTGTQALLLQHLRAALSRKPFLVLDEPFRGLDGDSIGQLGRLCCDTSPRRTVLICSTHPEARIPTGFRANWNPDLSEPRLDCGSLLPLSCSQPAAGPLGLGTIMGFSVCVPTMQQPNNGQGYCH